MEVDTSKRFVVTILVVTYWLGLIRHVSARSQVRKWIEQMKAEGKAFYSRNTYLLAGVLLQLPARMDEDGDVAPLTPPHGEGNNIVPARRRIRRPLRPTEGYKGRKPAAPCSATAEDQLKPDG